MSGFVIKPQGHACNCVGPQNGQPKCPCQMAGVVQRDGRWIQLERDLGPVQPVHQVPVQHRGCICPPGAETTCQGLCPRKPAMGIKFGTALSSGTGNPA